MWSFGYQDGYCNRDPIADSMFSDEDRRRSYYAGYRYGIRMQKVYMLEKESKKLLDADYVK